MNISFSGYNRCLKNFCPTQIFLKCAKPNGVRKYSLYDKKNLPSGRFCIREDESSLYVFSLSLNKKIQRKKAGANAIISIRNFIEDYCQKHKLRVVVFSSKNNPSIVNLYKKLGGIIVRENKNDILYMAPVSKTAEELKKTDELAMSALQKIAEKAGFIVPSKSEIKFKHFPIENLLPL